MLQVILHQPEIPPNTGNIIRLCANTSTQLHLIKPLGFNLSDRQLKRAGLDYHEWARLTVHEDLASCLSLMDGCRIFAVTTKATKHYDKVDYTTDDVFLFGSETCGLPVEVLEDFSQDRRIRIPMVPSSRSLNLSNSAAVIIYEAWRQTGFDGGV
ncbi:MULTISPECIES: tRNA (uridine(34)/cytosine(34)/5-carboxymethylaminomethyluridine(34)-2'-O)-methyltransferase TrmL [Nitrosomonas]|uniref:tRNA (cytidine(34)-2'-O)-methyltransferase n=2 Tax=Nitrosomonas eutropha TaxID=916 RepID=A0ABX5MAI2_9PROT|nr:MULTISPECIES: tRNA (uridine(34)/cytosine(34)/5-carboxymethylaminomethyluridine(34)-2'-O)-methyltransferase TrmL [Nitrosomonas]ABI60362.1 RNA methyltransferase, TrmH family, group 2 [Nitrosomonas eutropha C91]MXS80497.1 tRNA (uridine(34)/cytosine(34)/5-carboxymethylaminomethyluridine(34)-2'-O)-methyltransferase TrmL [Nitrosomonas sp. GH22]PXV83766.1 tRNA (cytidine/uridine-2'-O-)-methyltransferase [Nitrosomonas eutropha]SDW54268.1 tRNA (cytidine/uridine-2'-O-)-methyltransferase [Nitrosomonas e